MIFSDNVYLIECLDEEGGENREHHAGDQLQHKAVQPHIHGEDVFVNNLKVEFSFSYQLCRA